MRRRTADVFDDLPGPPGEQGALSGRQVALNEVVLEDGQDRHRQRLVTVQRLHSSAAGAAVQVPVHQSQVQLPKTDIDKYILIRNC